MRRKARSFGVPWVRDVVAKAYIGPRSGNSVSHPRVEKSAFQEIRGNSKFSTGEEMVLLGAVTERNPDWLLPHASVFLSINLTLFGLHGIGYTDAYLRDFMFESCEISLRRQGQNRDNR